MMDSSGSNTGRPRGALVDSKVALSRMRHESGVSYEDIGTAAQIHDAHVYAWFNHREEKKHMRIGDLIAMSKSKVTRVRLFVHAVVQCVADNLKEARNEQH